MAWDVTWLPVDGTVPDDGDFNLFLTANLHELKGDSAGQTVTERLTTVFASGFEIVSGQELRHTYTGAGSAFRLIYESAAPGVGAKIRLGLAVADSEDPEGTEEKLGFIEVARTGADSGQLSLGAYEDDGDGGQVTASVPALRIMPDGKGAFGKAAAAYDYDAAGPVRAAAFQQAGSPVGQWTEVSGDKTFTGNARVSGQLIQADASSEFDTATPMFDFLSRTLIANSNVGKLLGNAWQSGATQIAQSPAAVSVPATFTPVDIVPLVLERAGTHILLFASSVINTSTENAFAYAKLPGMVLSGGYPLYGGSGGGDRETFPCYGISVHTATAPGETVTGQLINGGYVDVTATGQLVALWCSPGLIVLIRPIQPTWQMGQLGAITVT